MIRLSPSIPHTVVRTALSAALVLTALAPPPAVAQAPAGYLEEWTLQFEASARKFVALAEAMPAGTYDWRPADGVASVAEVFMHIARYNYYYPDTSLDVDPPAGMDYDALQGVVNDKAAVVPILAESMDHVRRVVREMGQADLQSTTRLYGRDVGQYAVLLQLLTHMNEHLGQSIAYARSNGVVPPWSG
ncbi:MAG: DinB family protein [Longimicrobiales bacterium]